MKKILIFLSMLLSGITGIAQHVISTPTPQGYWNLNGNTTGASNWLGSSNSQPLIFKTNNTERFRIGSAGTFSFNTYSVNFGTGGTVAYTTSGWQLAGNAVGSNTAFIGSTDNRSLIFKTNNSQRLKIDSIGIFRFNGKSVLTNTVEGQNIFSVTHTLTASTGLGVSNLFTTYMNSGNASQHGTAFFSAYSVPSQTNITQANGLLTAFYHYNPFTIPKWQGIETGGAFIDGAGAVITNAYGLSAHMPSCTNGGSVTNAAAIEITSMSNTGITNPYAIYSESAYNSVFNGAITIGTITPVTSSLVKLGVAKGTSTIELGEASSGIGAIWGNQSTKTNSTAAIMFNGNTITEVQGPSDLRFKINGSIIGRFTSSAYYCSVPAAINKSSAAVASAALEIESTTKGFLPPRMTATQGSAISSPAEGLIIYVTDTNGTFTAKGWWGYDGAAWNKLN